MGITSKTSPEESLTYLRRNRRPKFEDYLRGKLRANVLDLAQLHAQDYESIPWYKWRQRRIAARNIINSVIMYDSLETASPEELLALVITPSEIKARIEGQRKQKIQAVKEKLATTASGVEMAPEIKVDEQEHDETDSLIAISLATGALSPSELQSPGQLVRQSESDE
jgi:hypothetical protein